MTIGTSVAAKSSSTQATPLIAAVASIVLGFAIVFVAGHVQANALHDAAHDVRHATGFPCH
ncbi:CbtB domain-containing protein [Stappia stellulata]|uniref:CbtB domain-containing protein n=1 Tax=Stappia stellulata TaxID=71235 RepID=UPI0004225FA8|nr:CbtB domain-containing protein [Stappia stellulata]